jgi:hypothetical protein
VITDDELLAAVRSAGAPGTESHRKACRLYRRSVLEWRARSGYAPRAALRQFIALLTAQAADAGWFDYTGCGTHDGYNKHAYDRAPACAACLEAEREYSRDRKRAQVRAKNEQAWQAAA